MFDDQLHFVRGSRPSPARLRAIAQGPSSAPTVKSNPYNPQGRADERGEPWGVWNPDEFLEATRVFVPRLHSASVQSAATLCNLFHRVS